MEYMELFLLQGFLLSGFLTAEHCLHQLHCIFSWLPNVQWRRYDLLRPAEHSVHRLLGTYLVVVPLNSPGLLMQSHYPTAGFVDTY